jgi:hypothetical protein
VAAAAMTPSTWAMTSMTTAGAASQGARAVTLKTVRAGVMARDVTVMTTMVAMARADLTLMTATAATSTRAVTSNHGCDG